MIFLSHFFDSRNSRPLFAVFFLLMFFTACNLKKQNRLSKASSPYLLEHANNPVDWYEWGDEALAAAKKENKPLLISIGYAACHWCHQMKRESFMDTAVARLMNDNFICIKVDREERPDIDNIYQDACQLISGNSGWPLNAFALPDGKPFFAGTYYAKEGWMSLLKQITAAYKTKNKKVMLQAQSLSDGIAKLEFSVLTDSVAGNYDKKMYQHYFENIYKKLDINLGGLKGTPKFPAPYTIEFLLQYYFFTKDKRALDIATTTLTRMALGAIYDQVGGGFARYATDSLWRIPHFEKMLYDNAQLISVYAHAYQLTGNSFFKKIAEETCAFVQRELGNPKGGYSSSVNADTDNEEGQFYSWSAAEVKATIPGNYQLISNYYNISEKGNWKNNRNVLYASATPDQYAVAQNINPVEFSKILGEANTTLMSERSKRIQPTVDDKVLTSWNALVIEGFLDAYAAFGDDKYKQQAVSAAGFIKEKMLNNDGRLWRSLKKNDAANNGFLDDYAFLARSYIHLYQLTFDKKWLLQAQQLAVYLVKNFYDSQSGMFYYSEIKADANLVNKIQITDNSIPASNAIIAGVLRDLSIFFDKEAYKNISQRMLARMANQLNKGETVYFSSWCALAGLFSYDTNEVAIVGPDALSQNLVLQKKYLPACLFMGAVAADNLPILKGKSGEGKTLIYVCVSGTCKRPVDNTTMALKQLFSY